MKRLLPFLLALLLLLPCLAACKTPPAPDQETGTDAPPDITPTAQPLVLVKDGASEYVIVRPADITAQDPAFIAAVLFRDTVEKLTGVALQIVTDDENAYAVADKEIVQLKIESDGRTLIFDDVVVRVSDSFALACHLDTDEANAAGCAGEVYGEIIKK